MAIDTQHPLYGPLEVKRDVFRAVQSTDCIRACGDKYLPKYPAEETNDYKARLGAATIDGIVSGGVDALCGAVFYGDIDVSKVNASIVPLLENIDNEGNHFNVFARRSFEASFEGCAFILVDAPSVDRSIVQSLEDEQRNGVRPYWRLYKAADIINWIYSVDPISKETFLSLIVLHEGGEEIVDRFERKPVDRYRVLSCENDVVTWELYKKVKDATGKDRFDLEGEGVIENVPEIPGAFIGCVEDDPKLLVESRLEIKAYQKESSFDQIEYLSIPTFYTKGYDGEEKLSLGASAHLKLPVDGEVGFAQIDAMGHESLKGTIAAIKDYIKSRLNALVEQTSPDKTATQSVIEDKDKQARLIVWAEQLKDALETALMYTGQMMKLGEDKGGEIVLNTKWAAAQMAREEAQKQLANNPEPFKKAA